MSTDTAIARRIAAGDAGAFVQLMRRHNRALYRAARAILRSDAAAEDAVQEAWVNAYRAMPAFRGEAKLATWLMRIVINEALGQRRRIEAAGETPSDAGPEAAAAAEEGPEELAHGGELRRMLEARIDTLPAIFRVVFVLRAAHEHSVREVAAILGIPEATVRTRFLRARERLRAQFPSPRSLLEP